LRRAGRKAFPGNSFGPRAGDEAVLKQFPNAMKPFWRHCANVLKRLTCTGLSNDALELARQGANQTDYRGRQMFNSFRLNTRLAAAAIGVLAVGATAFSAPAAAAPLPLFPFFLAPPVEAAPPPVQAAPSDEGTIIEMPARLRRQVVNYATREAPGTIIIDTPNTYLYLVMGNGQAMRYGIGVGRDGFTWSGTQTITKKAEWPDWTPPPEMIARQPYLPRQMAGGPGNPLGARAMYLGGTIYRIHGTNAPGTIGTHVSSGCLRLTTEDVTDLYSRVSVGTKVIVLPMRDRRADLGTTIR
jgi:lipoprotein-anchoring transpeptidase ErfK/SrfK